MRRFGGSSGAHCVLSPGTRGEIVPIKRGPMSLRFLVPCTVTFLGHLLGLYWLASGRPLFAILSLACDFFDGRIARVFSAVSPFGSEFDWLVDVTLAALIVGRFFPCWVFVVLVPVQALSRTRRWHFSGRFALTVLALWVRL